VAGCQQQNLTNPRNAHFIGSHEKSGNPKT
jgi:hypothetical protein